MQTQKECPAPIYLLSVVIILTLLLAGCAGLSSVLDATQPPMSTGPTETPFSEAGEAPAAMPTQAPTATILLLPTSDTNAADGGETAQDEGVTDGTQEAEGVDFGIAPINILRPGQFSRLASPFEIRANLQTGDDLRMSITLYGEDGRVLANKIHFAYPYDDPLNGNVITNIDFDIDIQAEAGRLEFKVNDQFGRLKALNSVNLVLLSGLPSDRNYAPESADRFLLQLPFPAQQEIAGSPLLVSGLVRTESDRPLEIWLEDEQGNHVGEGAASVVRTPGSDYGQFIGEIPYQVGQPTRVLMIMALSDSRIPGYTYVKSVELLLLP